MNKSLIDLITKVTLCGILILILVVLLNTIKEPYSVRSGDYDSQEDIKRAYLKTKKVGADLDKALLDKYIENLEAPTPEEVSRTPKKNEYYIPLPKEVSVIGYGRGDKLKKVPPKKKKK